MDAEVIRGRGLISPQDRRCATGAPIAVVLGRPVWSVRLRRRINQRPLQVIYIHSEISGSYKAFLAAVNIKPHLNPATYLRAEAFRFMT